MREGGGVEGERERRRKRHSMQHVCCTRKGEVYTMEPLNKGHLHTEAIVPHSEVVPYWEVFQKK